MDKACITVAAGHKQMLLATSASPPAGGISMLGTAHLQRSRIAGVDREAVLAEQCMNLATRGFQPIENVMEMKEW